MTKDILDEFIRLSSQEVAHTIETRQIAFEDDMKIRNGIMVLLNILVGKSVITAEEAGRVIDSMAGKKEEQA